MCQAYQLLLQVEPNRGRDYRYRRLPSAQSCFFNAVSSLPSTVNFTNITVLELSEYIIVHIAYSIPSETYSRSVEYELTISQTELSYNQTVLPTNSITILTEVSEQYYCFMCTTLYYQYMVDLSLHLMQATNITINELNRFDSNISCYFLQVSDCIKYVLHQKEGSEGGGDNEGEGEGERVTNMRSKCVLQFNCLLFK